MRKTNYLTVKQVKNACAEYDYILFRNRYGDLAGYNTKFSKLSLRKRDYKDTDSTSFVSFIPCDLNTYINFKAPYYTTK